MKKSTISTLTLKFKRHNLNFNYDEEKNIIEIGKTTKVKRKILKGILLILISLIALIFVGLFDFPFRKLVGYLVFIPFAFALAEIWSYLQLAGLNKNRNLIKPNEIIVENKEGTISIKAETIDKIDVYIDKIDAMSGLGALLFHLKNGQKFSLFTLSGKNISHLRQDLEYLKKIIEEHIGIKLKVDK